MTKILVSTTVRSNLSLVLVVLGIVSVFATPKVEGAGFQNPPPGAAASAQAGAFVAQADDATAITHNPAGLTQTSGTSVLLTPTFIYPSTKYYAPGGQTETIKEGLHILPNLYFATDLKKDQLAVWTGNHHTFRPINRMA